MSLAARSDTVASYYYVHVFWQAGSCCLLLLLTAG